MNTTLIIILIVAAFVAGSGIAIGLFFLIQGKKAKGIIETANIEAEAIKKAKMLEVKEKYLQLKNEFEKQANARNAKMKQAETKIVQKEKQLAQQEEAIVKKEGEIEQMKANYEAQLDIAEKKDQELNRLHQQAIDKLESIAGMSAEEAKNNMIESLKAEANTAAIAYTNEIMEEARMNGNKEAKKIIIQSIQRVASETAIENAVTVFQIENDEMKGRIIGREGRNIRALEAATGVEIVVDDTPEAIVLSAFDPIRREIAPTRPSEAIFQSKNEKQYLVRLVGKMKYRSSYGQNLLQHSRETANLCAVMASELGLNPKKARRAGLLHDIGKVAEDEDQELPHALLGMKIAQRCGEKPDICNAIGAHHEEVEMQSLISPIVQACDAISGARPGARREIVEAYIKRLNDLENLAMSYPGVQKTYAIQAGRELRVIVGADKVSDAETERLSGEIAKKIQDEMTYPGQVKITVIREVRSVAVAK